MSHVAPPLPDAKLKPKPAAEMAGEGEREGPVLTDAAAPDAKRDEGEEPAADPQFAQNGD